MNPVLYCSGAPHESGHAALTPVCPRTRTMRRLIASLLYLIVVRSGLSPGRSQAFADVQSSPVVKRVRVQSLSGHCAAFTLLQLKPAPGPIDMPYYAGLSRS